MYNANLAEVHAIGTTFNGAKMPGAYLGNWNISAATNLREVTSNSELGQILATLLSQ